MSGKGVFRIVDLGEIDTRGANIFKQEALSVGAELALPRDAAGFKSEKVRAVLMATSVQIEKLAEKLKAQPFGLKEVGERLLEVHEGYDADFKLVSPHGRELGLERAVVMGVLNVTPDSFFDSFDSVETATARASEMVSEGAKIIDIGGESTGPGSQDVAVEEELRRVIPVVEAVRKELPDIFISIDTWKSEVARAAIEAGADMVNDVTAGILDMDVPIVLMHSKDDSPRTTTDKVEYEDVMKTVIEFLEEKIAICKSSQIIVDPGMGAFVSGNPEYSYEILHRLGELRSLGKPILVGASRKSFLGGEVEDRLEGSLAAACMAVMNGAKIVRAHDVGATFKAISVCEA